MVLDTARPKNKLSTIWLGMCEIQFFVKHNSQSDGQKPKCKEWDEFAKEDHTYHLTPGEFKKY